MSPVSLGIGGGGGGAAATPEQKTASPSFETGSLSKAALPESVSSDFLMWRSESFNFSRCFCPFDIFSLSANFSFLFSPIISFSSFGFVLHFRPKAFDGIWNLDDALFDNGFVELLIGDGETFLLAIRFALPIVSTTWDGFRVLWVKDDEYEVYVLLHVLQEYTRFKCSCTVCS